MKKYQWKKMFFLISIMVFLTLTGCGEGKQVEKKRETLKGQTKNVTDLAGRQVDIPKEAKKVIITAPGHGGAFMTMCALLGEDTPDYLVGWDNRLKTDNLDMYNHYLKTMPQLEQIPDVGSVFRENFNVEKIIELSPDLCIFSVEEKDAIESIAASKLEKAEIPYIYVQYVDEKTENQEKSTKLIGEVFGKEERAHELIDYCIGKRKMVEERVAKVVSSGQEKPKVYFECAAMGPEEYGYTYSNDIQWGLITTMAGGENISNGKFPKYGQLDLETMLREDPDVIFFTGAYWPKSPTSLRMGYDVEENQAREQLKGFLNRTGWSDLKAVKNKKIYLIYHSMGCELFDFAALEFVAKGIYPEEFKDIDPQADLEKYFDKYLPFNLEGTWMLKGE